jgi:hypothetical protein
MQATWSAATDSATGVPWITVTEGSVTRHPRSTSSTPRQRNMVHHAVVHARHGAARAQLPSVAWRSLQAPTRWAAAAPAAFAAASRCGGRTRWRNRRQGPVERSRPVPARVGALAGDVRVCALRLGRRRGSAAASAASTASTGRRAGCAGRGGVGRRRRRGRFGAPPCLTCRGNKPCWISAPTSGRRAAPIAGCTGSCQRAWR